MRSHDSFLPATFEERGVALSFTTPALAYARIRKDYRDRLEVVLPNIGDAKGTFVIPWSALAETVTLTAHDRALQEEVQDNDAMSPYDIRRAELVIARDGLAGADAADAAARALEEDAKHVDLTNLMFMAKVIMASGTLTKEMLAGLANGKSDQMVREAAYKVAGTIGLKPSQLDEKLGTLSRVVAPLGIEGSPEQGRLRRLILGLGEFRDSLDRWAADNIHCEVELARFCVEVADLTLVRGIRIAQEFDANLREPLNILKNWEFESPKLKNAVIRLSWLFDGWDMIIRTWEAAKKQSRDAQEAALFTIFRAMPLLPKEELEPAEASKASSLRISRKRAVRMYENWSTGELDFDLLSRIEAMKAQVA
ncbi:MAG TPA: hypothetical protein VKZ79_02935 [Alphaproteobacteria bacterium]|nr:hypothetical protein [Alphaproteobacteria bacterium]